MRTRITALAMLTLGLVPPLTARADQNQPAEAHKACVSARLPAGVGWSRATQEAFCDDHHVVAIAGPEIESLIRSGRGRELDARFAAIHSAYFAGNIPEGAVRNAWQRFRRPDPSTEALAEDWFKQSPGGGYALAARGVYRVEKAIFIRGDATIERTPEDQLRRMAGQLTLGRKDLEAALRINHRLLVAYENLIQAARYVRDQEVARRNHEDALAVDPRNFYARDAALAKDPDFTAALNRLADLLMRTRDYARAKNRLERAYALDPANNWTLRKLAWIHVYIQRDYRKAETWLAELLEREPKSGAAWLMRSELLHVQGRPGLREALENFLRYADPEDEEQRRSIPEARDWLARNGSEGA